MDRNYFDCTLIAEDSFLHHGNVNREVQTSECINGILAHEKVAIIGARGIGKSMLILNIQKELAEKHPPVLPIYLNFSRGYLVGGVAKNSFICFMLQSLIDYVWVNILGNKASSLYEVSNDTMMQSELESKVSRLHKLTRIIGANIEISNRYHIGAKLVAEGSYDKANNRELGLSPLSEREFTNLFLELCADLEEYLSIDTIVFLCDEANHLPIGMMQH